MITKTFTASTPGGLYTFRARTRPAAVVMRAQNVHHRVRPDRPYLVETFDDVAEAIRCCRLSHDVVSDQIEEGPGEARTTEAQRKALAAAREAFARGERTLDLDLCLGGEVDGEEGCMLVGSGLIRMATGAAVGDVVELKITPAGRISFRHRTFGKPWAWYEIAPL